jgi:hypothetical protein
VVAKYRYLIWTLFSIDLAERGRGWEALPAFFISDGKGGIRLILTTSSRQTALFRTRQIHKIGIAIPTFATIRYGLPIPQAIMLVAMVKNTTVMVINRIPIRIPIHLNHQHLLNPMKIRMMRIFSTLKSLETMKIMDVKLLLVKL